MSDELKPVAVRQLVILAKDRASWIWGGLSTLAAAAPVVANAVHNDHLGLAAIVTLAFLSFAGVLSIGAAFLYLLDRAQRVRIENRSGPAVLQDLLRWLTRPNISIKMLPDAVGYDFHFFSEDERATHRVPMVFFKETGKPWVYVTARVVFTPEENQRIETYASWFYYEYKAMVLQRAIQSRDVDDAPPGELVLELKNETLDVELRNVHALSAFTTHLAFTYHLVNLLKGKALAFADEVEREQKKKAAFIAHVQATKEMQRRSHEQLESPSPSDPQKS